MTGASERVGQNVRRQRQRRGWTLAQLSANLDQVGHPIGVASLSKIELGQRGIAVDDLEGLAKALGVTSDRLLIQADEDAVVRLTRLIIEMGQMDHAVSEAEQELYRRSWELRELREHLDKFKDRVKTELNNNADLIDHLEGPAAVRALEVARSIVADEMPAREASKRLL